ncbi:MAG: DUF5715 family protein [Saprospiraceae bacterium]
MRLVFLLLVSVLCLSASPGPSDLGSASLQTAVEGNSTLGFSESEWIVFQDSILTDFRKHLKKREAKFLKVPLFKRSEKKILRTSRNNCHVETAEKIGIEHGTSFGESKLQCLSANSKHYVEYDCHAQLEPNALASLDILGYKFHQALAVAGLPPVRFAISSAYRSAEYQRKLRRKNRNATRTTSSHEFGTTYDLAYRRFFGMTESAKDFHQYRLRKTSDERMVCLVEDIEATERAWSSRMTDRYIRRLEAILGRTLIELEGDGTLLVLREWRQPCFHITVARELVGGKA